MRTELTSASWDANALRRNVNSRSIGARALRTARLLAPAVAAGLVSFYFQLAAAQARIVTYHLDMRAQSLEDALQAFALASKLKLLYSSDVVAGKSAAALKGEFTAEQALHLLLLRTGLEYEISEGLIFIRPEDPHPGSRSREKATSDAPSSAGVAPADDVSDSAVGDTRGSSTTGAGQLTEVIVTAQKQEQRLQDVPVSVTVVNADSLADNNQLRLQDYYMTVPGLSLVSNGQGADTLSIRGVTTGQLGGSTVGIVIDDAPFGSSTPLSFRQAAPDLDPSELVRIEVLSGPQGTLYGSNSIGGLLKFVTVDPSTAGFSGRVEAGTDTVYNGAGPGYNFRGAVNVPVNDTLAIRTSGFVRRDPGYVDGLFAGPSVARFDGINQTDVQGGRFAALWKPSGDWSVKLGALFQHTSAEGASTVILPSIAKLTTPLYVRGPEPYSEDVRLYTAAVAGTAGSIKLNSVTSYNSDRFTEPYNLTGVVPFYSELADQLYNVTGVELREYRLTRKLTQELRASGEIGRVVDWLAGAFYTHESTPTHDTASATNPQTLSVAGLLYDDPYPTTFQEYALFADLTFHLTRQLDVQLGGRESWNRQGYHETVTGPAVPDVYGLPSPVVQGQVDTHGSAFTFLVTPTFKLTPDVMVYARVASGYRPGGPNPTCTVYGIPCEFGPDRTINYELGLKAETLQHRLSFDASLYRIDWQNIQLQICSAGCFVGYFANASSAKSQGLELSAQARPLTNTRLSAWTTWTDAKLSSAIAANAEVAADPGAPLPYTARFSANIAASQERRLTDRITAFAGLVYSYQGDRKSGFGGTAVAQRLDLPGYSLLNLHVGARVASSWSANIYANNVADSRGIVSGNGLRAPQVIYVQPRTIGIVLSRQF